MSYSLSQSFIHAEIIIRTIFAQVCPHRPSFPGTIMPLSSHNLRSQDSVEEDIVKCLNPILIFSSFHLKPALPLFELEVVFDQSSCMPDI